MAQRVATEAFADDRPAGRGGGRGVHLNRDLGEAPLTVTSKNRCVVWQRLRDQRDQRGGKCLYCFNNPGQMVDGKPKALAAHYEQEEKGG